MNNVALIGRLTRDPELKTTSTGKSVCSFSLAVSKRTRPQDGSPDAEFFNCVAWERQAEYVTNYLAKGRLVAITGRLQSRRYTTSSGDSREIVEVVAESVQGLDRPREGDPPSKSHLPDPPASDDTYDPFNDQ